MMLLVKLPVAAAQQKMHWQDDGKEVIDVVSLVKTKPPESVSVHKTLL